MITDATKIKFDVSARAMGLWNSAIKPAAKADNEINIFEEIGADPWTGGGITAASIKARLDNIGDGDVVVNINSPGGDMFEGLAIYNLLRAHSGAVSVRVLGLAASAASLVAMAGQNIEIAKAGFLMIHNAWVMAVGNRLDLRAIADTLETLDDAMAGIYADRSGAAVADITAKLDAETWIGGQEAIDMGLADALLPADQIAVEQDSAASAAARLDQALAKTGMPRSERRKLMQQVKAGTPSAAEDDTPRAVDEGKRFYLAAVTEAIPQFKEKI